KAEDENGERLLDVLDIHYYTEAKGECGERSCSHYNQEGCVEARLNSTRSLWEEGYKEDSWIVDTGAEFFPLLPNIRQSIDKYYPGTKLAITEYDFGGSYDICGGIAEADALGLFAKHGVYLATLFTGDDGYQCSAIDLYTNYDGKGSGFGDTLVYCETDDIELSTAYAAVNEGSDDVITLVVTNKSFTDKTTASIKLEGENEYSYVHLYGLGKMAPGVFDMTDSNPAVSISGDTVTYEMQPETVSLLVIGKDKNAVEQLETETAAESTSPEKESSSHAGLIAGICAGVAAVIAGTGILISRKKRAKGE
ncbi:MAG: glycoside hydrolase, partial [Ruminococcus sp.]|nr:glycoside hydrolase [Ruminococcus sp.]